MSQAGMSSVCRTLSLATLQNVFPGAKHWRQRPSRALPTEQSPYVIEFIGAVQWIDRMTVVSLQWRPLVRSTDVRSFRMQDQFLADPNQNHLY